MLEHGIAVAPAAAFEGELGIKPQSHIFAASKAPWDVITDGLPEFDAYPPGFDAQGVARPSVTPPLKASETPSRKTRSSPGSGSGGIT